MMIVCGAFSLSMRKNTGIVKLLDIVPRVRSEVCEWGCRVVKLYRSFREAAIHAAVEALGLPLPAVWRVQQIHGRWGIVFDRVSGLSLAEQMRRDMAHAAQYLQILARLHRRIHTHLANQFNSLKAWLATDIARTMLLDEPRKQVLLSGLAKRPDGNRLCHGDFHPMNVLGEASRPIVIDWPNACCGDPAGDVCRSYLILKLHADEIARPYLDAYCQVALVPRHTILDWLPYVSAGRLVENVPGEQHRLLELVRSP
jgi:aminoglycoside phosphotransferase (APT) family kinase protein